MCAKKKRESCIPATEHRRSERTGDRREDFLIRVGGLRKECPMKELSKGVSTQEGSLTLPALSLKGEAGSARSGKYEILGKGGEG